MYRKIGWGFIIIAVLSMLGELLGIQLPTARWPFSVSYDLSWLHMEKAGESGEKIPVGGWVISAMMLITGVIMLLCHPKGQIMSPITKRRIQRFKDIRRGYISLWIVGIFALLACLDQTIVGKRALAVNYGGKWYFPAFVDKEYKGKEFGFAGELGESEANYRKLKSKLDKKEGKESGWVIMPLVPYEPTLDTLPAPVVELEQRNGQYFRAGEDKPYSGYAARLFNKESSSDFHLRYRLRDGKFDGAVEGRDASGNNVYRANYTKGEIDKSSERYDGEGSIDNYINQESSALLEILHAPSRPSLTSGHLLGTTPGSTDLIAYLYGGLQINFKAALFYIPCVYVIGISVGLLMGYFGGWFDLIVQRLIEILANVPFLFVIIMISSLFDADDKGLGLILGILIIFGWMGMTGLMRTAAYKEKARDYIAASKVLGASTPRVIFKHILPNTMAILVTLVPFSVSGLVMALTSLDYLGFGLPAKYATWGTLLKDGLANLSAPWLVSSAFFCLVSLLILITFIGEAVREAFDPKKFTYYK